MERIRSLFVQLLIGPHQRYKVLRIAQINYAVKQALTEREQKYAQEEENRIISLIKKGKSLEDILDFSVLPPERVQQLWDENHP